MRNGHFVVLCILGGLLVAACGGATPSIDPERVTDLTNRCFTEQPGYGTVDACRELASYAPAEPHLPVGEQTPCRAAMHACELGTDMFGCRGLSSYCSVPPDQALLRQEELLLRGCEELHQAAACERLESEYEFGDLKARATPEKLAHLKAVSCPAKWTYPCEDYVKALAPDRSVEAEGLARAYACVPTMPAPVCDGKAGAFLAKTFRYQGDSRTSPYYLLGLALLESGCSAGDDDSCQSAEAEYAEHFFKDKTRLPHILAKRCRAKKEGACEKLARSLATHSMSAIEARAVLMEGCQTAICFSWGAAAVSSGDQEGMKLLFQRAAEIALPICAKTDRVACHQWTDGNRALALGAFDQPQRKAMEEQFRELCGDTDDCAARTGIYLASLGDTARAYPHLERACLNTLTAPTADTEACSFWGTTAGKLTEKQKEAVAAKLKSKCGTQSSCLAAGGRFFAGINDSARAVAFLEPACKEGVEGTCKDLGNVLMNMPPPHPERGIALLEASCSKDKDAGSCYTLANVYARGKLVAKDLTIAEKYLREACANGEQLACPAHSGSGPPTFGALAEALSGVGQVLKVPGSIIMAPFCVFGSSNPLCPATWW